jgi:hypothetical protein
MTKAQVQEFAINKAILHHNYSSRNLDKYKSLRSRGGATREELSRGDTLPTIGRDHFLRKASRLFCMHDFTLLI